MIGNIDSQVAVIYYAFMPYLVEKEDVDHVSSWECARIHGWFIDLIHLGLGLTLIHTDHTSIHLRY